MFAAIFDLNGRAPFLSWHFIQISLPNALVILAMFVVFGVALFVRFPGGHHGGEDEGR